MVAHWLAAAPSFPFDAFPSLLIGVLAALLTILLLLLAPQVFARRSPAFRGRATINRLLGPLFGQQVNSALAVQLHQARLALYPADLLALSLGLALGVSIGFSLVFGYVLIACLVGGVAATLPFLWVRRRAQRFERQFITDVQSWCLVLAGAARSNMSQESLLELASRAPAPLGEYFDQVVRTMNLPGTDSLQALASLAASPHPPELDPLIRAFRLHFEIGGPIAQQLIKAAADLREMIKRNNRLRLRLSRLQSNFWLTCFFPVGFLLLVRLADPRAVNLFLGSAFGQVYYLTLWVPVGIVALIIRRLSRLPGMGRRR